MVCFRALGLGLCIFPPLAAVSFISIHLKLYYVKPHCPISGPSVPLYFACTIATLQDTSTPLPCQQPWWVATFIMSSYSGLFFGPSASASLPHWLLLRLFSLLSSRTISSTTGILQVDICCEAQAAGVDVFLYYKYTKPFASLSSLRSSQYFS